MQVGGRTVSWSAWQDGILRPKPESSRSPQLLQTCSCARLRFSFMRPVRPVQESLGSMLADCAFLRRTSGPPPFSSMNSMPAASKALRTARSLASVIDVWFSVSSARRMVATLRSDCRARFSALQRRRARAALIWGAGERQTVKVRDQARQADYPSVVAPSAEGSNRAEPRRDPPGQPRRLLAGRSRRPGHAQFD